MADRAVARDASLRDLVPDTALLAVEIRDLDQRWGEIRQIHAIASFQNSLLSCAGMNPNSVPRLAGDRAVLFLTRSHGEELVVIGILRPRNMAEAEDILSGIEKLSHRRGQSALWVGPRGVEEMLERFAREDGAPLSSCLPVDEIEGRLPSGGLLRGWVNPAAWLGLLRDPKIQTGPAPFQWIAALLEADLALARYAGFRHDIKDGALVIDEVLAYDSARLPPEVSQALDPNASPAIVPPEFPSNTLAAVALRPEPQAWMPWLRSVATRDPRGPLRNLGFWLDEFQERYRRTLEHDLFKALGDHGWVLVFNAEDSRSVEMVWVVEIREASNLEATLMDLLSWLSEQVLLGSYGTIIPRPWIESRQGNVIHGVILWTPFARIPGVYFHKR